MVDRDGPSDVYKDVPRASRRWLESQGAEDFARLERSVALTERLAAAGSFVKWGAAFIVGAAGFGAMVIGFWDRFRGK